MQLNWWHQPVTCFLLRKTGKKYEDNYQSVTLARTQANVTLIVSGHGNTVS